MAEIRQIWVIESIYTGRWASYPNKKLRDPKHFDTIKVTYSLHTEHIPYKMYMSITTKYNLVNIFSITEHTKSAGITALCLPQNNLIIALIIVFFISNAKWNTFGGLFPNVFEEAELTI